MLSASMLLLTKETRENSENNLLTLEATNNNQIKENRLPLTGFLAEYKLIKSLKSD